MVLLSTGADPGCFDRNCIILRKSRIVGIAVSSHRTRRGDSLVSVDTEKEAESAIVTFTLRILQFLHPLRDFRYGVCIGTAPLCGLELIATKFRAVSCYLGVPL